MQELKQDDLPELPFMSRNKVASDEPGSSKAKNTNSHLPMSTAKSKSRPLDQPDQTGKKSGRVLKLGLSPERRKDKDDFFAEDLPEQYKNARLNLVGFEWVTLFVVLGVLLITISSPQFRKTTIWGLLLWKWEVLGLVFICGRLLSWWGVGIIVFFVERNFFMRKRLLYFVYGLRRTVQSCLWLGLVMVAWQLRFYKKFEGETNSGILKSAANVLGCLFSGTTIWLGKTLTVKVVASSVHVSNYFDRIQESLFNRYVIETLSGPPLGKMRKAEEEEYKIVVEVETLQAEGRGRGKDREKGMYGNRMTNEQISGGHDEESSKQINCESEARAAAEKIFQNVAQQGSRHIYLDDLMRFMPEDEATKTMELFEGTNKKISKSSLENWVVSAFRERRALALTMSDIKTVVNSLHWMVNILVAVLIAEIWLLVLGFDTKNFLLFISSALVFVGFLFGKFFKMTIEGIIFLLIVNPFDIGDRCEVDGIEMVVEEMNILTTVFLRCDGQKIIIPNSVLMTKAIGNCRRSPDMGEQVEFCVPMSTPTEKVATMRDKITCYIENKKDHWYPAPIIIFKDVEDLNRIRIAVRLTHRMNHQDMDEKRARRALLVEELVGVLNELDIYMVDT